MFIDRATRRDVLRAGGMAGAAWLARAAQALASRAEGESKRQPARAIIWLWMAGGPSQLETFDPHAGQPVAGGTKAIDTAIANARLAAGLPRVAERLGHAMLIRDMVSKEGDHERGAYTVKTGYRPDPTLIHPSIGAICCHKLPRGDAEIPRHISILPDRFPARGGLLGSQYDAFKTSDPAERVPDVRATVSEPRFRSRLRDAEVIETEFARGRQSAASSTLHRPMLEEARRMMTSEQLTAFDVSREPAAVRAAYGDTPFGRGCLAARRLVEVGATCVEVTLPGWDSHAKNHEIHAERTATLDPALASLLSDLAERDMLERTIVFCGGEFGRTPRINKLEGRDHWPHGFSVLVAGGGLRRGLAVGSTDPAGERVPFDAGTKVADLHATLLMALGIDPREEVMSAVGRPIKLSEGEPIARLLDV